MKANNDAACVIRSLSHQTKSSHVHNTSPSLDREWKEKKKDRRSGQQSRDYTPPIIQFLFYQ